MNATHETEQTVFIVDDDASIRQSMGLLLGSVNIACESFESASDFLDAWSADKAGCLVLDIRMPGLGGLELQEKLNELDCSLPIIFITGHADVPMAVEAMQKGAFDFVQKPFRDQDLLDRINDALAAHSETRKEEAEQADIRAHIETLTPREKDVFELVVTGKPNKIIAHELSVSQRTVEIHRARVMEKMEAKSLATLVRMWAAIQA